MSYLSDSYIVFTLKMESVTKNTIFGLKMMVKSGLEKFILKSLNAGSTLDLVLPSFSISAIMWRNVRLKNSSCIIDRNTVVGRILVMAVCFKNFYWNTEQRHTNWYKRLVTLTPTSFVLYMDYGHTMAKSQILCGPSSNPNPK